MTEASRASSFAVAAVLLAVLQFFLIDDGMPSLSSIENAMTGHATLVGCRLGYIWLPSLAVIAVCWAVLMNFA